MPNTKSAIRRVRRVKKQTQINRIRKSKYKLAVKKMEKLMKEGDKDKKQTQVNRVRKSKYKNAIKQMDLLLKGKEKEKIKKYFSSFQSILMQVAKNGIINKKTASRKISRISKKI